MSMNYDNRTVSPDSTSWNRIASPRSTVEHIAAERAVEFPDSLAIALASEYCLMPTETFEFDADAGMFPGITVGGKWWSKHWPFIAHVVTGYSLHRGVWPQILWRADGPLLGCDSGDQGALVVSNSAVLYAVDTHVTVIPAHVVAEPEWLPGAKRGEAGIALNTSRTLLLGIGEVASENGNNLLESWLRAATCSRVLPLVAEQPNPQLTGRNSSFARS